MLKKNKEQSDIDLILLAVALPLVWKLLFYLLSPFRFVDDSYSGFRFLTFLLLIFIYFKPKKLRSLSYRTFYILLLFFIYGLTCYLFDFSVHFFLDKDLKLLYLDDFYSRNISSASEEELKSINSNYSMSSKENMIQSQLTRLFSIKAYIKSFCYDLIKYAAISLFLAKTYNGRAQKG